MSRYQLLSVALAVCSLGAAQMQAGDPFLDFKFRVTRYVQLRSDVERTAGVQTPSRANPRYAAEAQQRVVEGIRKGRDGADRGDFFRGPTEAALRQTLEPLIAAAEGSSIKAALNATSSEPIELTINGDYPCVGDTDAGADGNSSGLATAAGWPGIPLYPEAPGALRRAGQPGPGLRDDVVSLTQPVGPDDLVPATSTLPCSTAPSSTLSRGACTSPWTDPVAWI